MIDAYPEMRVGDRLVDARDGHMFVIAATNLNGLHSGRRRYSVMCRTCKMAVHPATTGPDEMIDMHLREVARGDVHAFPGVDYIA